MSTMCVCCCSSSVSVVFGRLGAGEHYAVLPSLVVQCGRDDGQTRLDVGRRLRRIVALRQCRTLGDAVVERALHAFTLTLHVLALLLRRRQLRRLRLGDVVRRALADGINSPAVRAAASHRRR
jgi:hypothetical protein